MSRYQRGKNKERAKTKSLTGFLLLEVVLSVFIVTVGVVFVIGSFITSIKTFKVSKSYLYALYLVEEKMWDYEGSLKEGEEGFSGEIETGRDSGDFEDYKDAEWHVEANELEDETPLNETTLEVVLKEEGKRLNFKVATYFKIKD